MQNYIPYIVVAIIFVLMCVFFDSRKKKYIKGMSKTLYADTNPDLYLERLDNVEGKIFLNKKVRLFRKIDAYAMKNDKENVIKTFKELESLKLSFGQEVSLYEKEVNYYVNQKMFEEAKVANNKVQELNTKVEIEDLNKIAVECNSLIEIYVNKNGSLANEMVKYGDEATIDTVKGTYYFRAAKCYFYRKDNKLTEKYLLKAQKYLEKTSTKPIIDKCIKDHNELNNY